MKEEFSNNELEKRLKQEADQFTLPPSEEVWDRINQQLHPRKDRRGWLWAAAGLLVLLLGAYILWPQRDLPRETVVSTASRTDSTASSKSLPAQESSANRASSKSTNAERQGTGSVAPMRQEGQETKAPHVAAALAGQQPQATTRLNPETTYGSSAMQPVGLPVLPSVAGMLPASAFADVSAPMGIAMPPRSLFINTDTTTAKVVPEPDDMPAGDKTKELKKKRRPVFEIFYTAGKGYRTLTMPDHPAAVAQMDNVLSGFAVVKDNKIDQKPDWDFAAGIRGIFPLGERWSVETGLSLIRTGYKVKAFGTYPAYIQTGGNYAMSMPSNRVNSFYATSNFATIQQQKPAYIQNRYLYGEIPLLIRRSFGPSEKIHFDLALGGGLLYLIKSSPVIFSPQSGRYFVDKEMLSPFNGNVQMEADVIFPISKKLNFTIGPSMQYQLFSTYKNYPQVKEHLYFPGIKAGLQWLK